MANLVNFFGVFRKGAPVAVTANAENITRLGRALAGLEGIGCRIEKPTAFGGFGWKIIVDGSSDIEPPPGFPTVRPLPTGGTQYQVLEKATDADYDMQWGWLKYKVPT